MKTLSTAALLLILAAPAWAGSYRPIDKAVRSMSKDLLESIRGEKVSTAVLPLENQAGQATELGRLIADGLTDELLKSGRVMVLERGYLSRLLEEIKMGMSGMTSGRSAAQLGKLTGAKHMLVGRIEPLGRNRLLASVRLVHTEKGNLIASARYELKLDKDLRRLYDKRAVLDPLSTGYFAADSRSGDAVFLNQTGKDGCRWVESKVSLSRKGMKKSEARAAALALARRKAVGRLTGEQPAHIPQFDEAAFKGRLEEVLRGTRSSLVEEEKIVEEKTKGAFYNLTLQSCLKTAKGGSNDSFHVELMLNQDRFFEGQDARVIVTADRDSWLYLYSVDFDQNAIRVLPVKGAGDNRARAGKPFIFPDEDRRKAGVSLEAALPEGAKNSIETFRVLAVRRDVGGLLDGITTYPGIIRALERSGDNWAEDVRVFTVYKR